LPVKKNVAASEAPVIVHLVDGTYELFRHFYGIRRFSKSDPPFGAALGVLRTVLQMIEEGATHIGVATDHVIESFRNELWPGYKTGDGIDYALRSQFLPLERGLEAMGVATWAMVEVEADDALAAAAFLAASEERVHKVCIWTPDKDLSQCVVDDRVVQIDRKSGQIRNAAGVKEKFGVEPRFIADYLALVGDAADGYPGIAGCGAKTAARLIAKYGPIEDFPDGVVDREKALLFKSLSTLRTDLPLFGSVEAIRWNGPLAEFESVATAMGDEVIAARARKAAAALADT
jgi:5'-3' exonuclease